MAVSRRSPRSRYVVAVLVLAAVTLVTIDARASGTGVTSDLRSKVHDVFSPLQRATHAALQPIGNFLTGALDYGSLRHENQVLRSELVQLQTQSITSAAERAAAEQVLAEEHLSFVGGIHSVAGEVIDNGFSNFENSLTLDKGTSSGVAVGQPVVASGGLVGTVRSVSATTATVMLLTDPTFAVGVTLPGGNVGTARGSGRGQPMRVTVVSTNRAAPAVAAGQPLVTSGLRLESFPPNIPVGRVQQATRAPGSAEPDITVTPLVDLNNLTYVRVLLWSAQ